MSEQKSDPIVRKKQLADELDVSATTLWRWDRNGVLPPQLKVGGWPRSVIDAWKIDQGWPAPESSSEATA